MTDILEKFGNLLKEAATPEDIPVPFDVRGDVTHKLTFRKGRAKNFRSIGNEFMEIDYQRNPATLVTSDDNGAGKSTMLVWLLFFVLYNDTYSKKEKKAGLVNSQNKKDCVGEVEFACRGSEWKVRRGIKPDFVEVHQMVDGEWKQVVNDAAKADMNKYIVNLIGIDQKMFENSLVLGKEKFIPFTEMYTADRRTMVEAIWDLGFFSLMNEDVKAKIKVLNKTLEDISNEFGMKMIDHTNKKTQLAQIIESNNRIQQQSAEILEQERIRLSSLDADISSYQDEMARLQEVEVNTKKEIGEVESRLNQESTEEIEKLKAQYAEKMKAVDDIASDKAEDYERIELSSAEQALNNIRDQARKVTERKNEVLNQRNENLNVINEAMERLRYGEGFRIKFQTEKEGYQESIQKFHDMGTCPTCQQEVSEEAKSQVQYEGNIKIKDVDSRIERLETMLEEINTTIAEHKAKDDEFVRQVAEIDAELSSLRDQAAEAHNGIETIKRDIQEFYKTAEIEKASLDRELKSQILSNRQALNTRFDDITASLQQTLETASQGRATVKDKIGELKARRAPLVASIADLERKLSVQPTPTADLEAVIAGIEQSMKDLEERRQTTDEELQDHNHLLHFLKDDQTKARIISLYLPFLNKKINEYLEGMNMFLDISVDDTFDITMGTAGRKGQSLFSLSSGQRVRVNIAITMALRDVANLKASVQCNILVFDEVLENLSERGVQECIEMLKYKFSNNNLFVISQREQEFQEYFSHNIRYGLRNGMTQVISKE
ncbi:recombination endonuclease subunit [Klebsiella phage 0507-KN2-1]|uniref:Recombination endonuclease subunit n=1 Tax=Klebsiella phage 0507-KN2-1 TaxID=2991282 RepID=S6C8L3_BPK05|nr:recombination endonuclease subunit [Klebsiella phage 0507-KN2-1]BAN78351.1 recombination endonuclease subunit [Klebsiella phage 0507-KN2-1]